jgi:hypothetical protein
VRLQFCPRRVRDDLSSLASGAARWLIDGSPPPTSGAALASVSHFAMEPARRSTCSTNRPGSFGMPSQVVYGGLALSVSARQVLNKVSCTAWS